MKFLHRHAKRILTDLAGYGLIVLGTLLSPVPGPGGLPLILAGLSILSIHNQWAKQLREYLLHHGGKLVQILFPKHRVVVIIYDIITVLLFVAVAYLSWRHAAAWQISLAVFLFFIGLLVASMNRGRWQRIKLKLK